MQIIKKYPLSKYHCKIKKIYKYVIPIKTLSVISNLSVKTIRRYLKKKFIHSTFSSNTHLIHVDSLILNFIPPCEKTLLKNYSTFGFYPEYNFFIHNILSAFWLNKKNFIALDKSVISIGLKKFVCLRTLLKLANL